MYLERIFNLKHHLLCYRVIKIKWGLMDIFACGSARAMLEINWLASASSALVVNTAVQYYAELE